MSEEELVQAYTEGSISRRVFVRRLIAGGLSITSALAYGLALDPAAAAAATSASHRHHHHHHRHRHHNQNPGPDPQDIHRHIRRILRRQRRHNP